MTEKREAGRTLVYLPGLDGSAELLFAQEPALRAAAYTVVPVRSRPTRDFLHEDLLVDVDAAIDANAGGAPVVLLGESFGGTVALRYALSRPERVARLVLVGAFPYFANRPLLAAGVALGRRVPPPVVSYVRRLVDVPTLALDGVPEDVRDRFVEITRRQAHDGYVRRMELVAEFDVRDRLAEVAVPTLVLAGGRDRLVSASSARELAERIPRARLRVVALAGHLCLLHPDVSLARMLEEWERALDGSACAADPSNSRPQS